MIALLPALVVLLPVTLRAHRSVILAPPEDRHGHAVVHYAPDHVLLIGGMSTHAAAREDFGKTTLIFDIPKRRWKYGPNLNSAMSNPKAVAIDGKVYAVGGSIECYDPDRNSWEVVYDGPGIPRSHFSCATDGKVLYLAGGFPEDCSTPRCFDPATGKLTVLPENPDFQPGDHFPVLGVLDGRLHVIGGVTKEVRFKKSHWTLHDGEWKKRAAPPVDLWTKLGVTGVHDNKLYAFVTVPDHGLCYDPLTDQWSQEIPSMPRQLALADALVRKGSLFSIGGLPVDQGLPGGLLEFNFEFGLWADPH